jgi:UDP-N-acetylmuramate--alanine ligase
MAIQNGLAEFRGTERRFEWKGEHQGVAVIDDYGHHPTEIIATLDTLKHCGFSRSLVAFQPHRYSRTKFLFDDFLHAFDQVDEVVLTEIYPASELPLEGISGQSLFERLRQESRAKIHFVPRVEEIAAFLLPRLRPGDVVLTLGAGNIAMAGTELLALLNNQEKKASRVEAGS